MDEGEDPGDGDVGRRSVGDVLAGEGGLVHVGAEVAGVDAEHGHVGLLLGQHPGEVLEGGLRRAVAAPALVRLGGGVRGDGDHRAVRAAQSRERSLHQPQRADDVGVEQGGQVVGGEGGDVGERAGSEVPGVEDDELGAAEPLGLGDELVDVGGVALVAGEGDEPLGAPAGVLGDERGCGGGERAGVAGVGDDGPAVVEQAGDERSTPTPSILRSPRRRFVRCGRPCRPPSVRLARTLSGLTQ